jgi:hypothetical protein
MKLTKPLPPTADLPDDRITCDTCIRRRGDGVCNEFGFKRTVLMRRCEFYLPNALQPDQRPGRVRWPHLASLNKRS